MQRNSKIALAATAAVVLVLGGYASFAVAHQNMGGHHGMMGMQDDMMERYDADGDGKLTQAEVDKNREQWHAEFDADKNATLSLDEFKALWLKARNRQMVRDYQEFDRDGNGQVTLDEYKQPMARMVAEHDRNGDGSLSHDDHGMDENMGGMMHGQKHGGGKGMMNMEEGDSH